MRGNSTELFATAKEQLDWLQAAAAGADTWCQLERPRIGRASVVPVSDLTVASLGNRFSRARLFLGRHVLAVPAWRPTPYGEEIDFVQSGAVLFEPSTETPRALLAGRLSIMGRAEYIAAGIRWEPIQAWYRHLLNSMKSALAAPGAVLLVSSPGAPLARARGAFLVSRGAVKLAQQGIPLKQYPESTIVMRIA